MNIEILLTQLEDKGIQVLVDNGELVVRAPRGAMNTELAARLKLHKAELLSLLQHRAAHAASSAAPAAVARITPQMLTLVSLQQEAIDRIVAGVEGGAANVQDIYPLAPLQEGILFHHLKEQQGDPYLLSNLLAFDDRERLERFLAALQQVVDRHDVLRTGFAWQGLEQPVQVVHAKAVLPVQWLELGASQDDVAAQLEARFDPRHHRIDVSRAPLLRAHAAWDGRQGRWLLHVLVHHLVSDHTTLELLVDEARTIERGEAHRLPAPVPFRNFVAQARLGISTAEHEAFFKAMLADVEEPTAPFGLTDVHGTGQQLVQLRRALKPELSQAVRQVAARRGTSAATLMHLAWGLVLSRLTGREQVVFGTVLFGRLQGGVGADRGFGLFMNTLPLRLDIDGTDVAQALEAARLRMAQLLRHEHASLTLAQRCSAVPPQAPLFTSLLNYRHTAEPVHGDAPAQPLGEGIELLRGDERTNYPVSLDVDDAAGGFMFTVQVPGSIDAQALCGWMVQAVSQLVEALQSPEGRPLSSLDILSPQERDRVLHEWSGRGVADAQLPRPAADVRLHELFERQAAQRPDAIALEQAGVALSYAELNARANQLAHHLRSRGLQSEGRVALCGPRSPEIVVAMLAVLKAGGAYVPLDPNYPPERLQQVLHSCGAALALVQGGLPAGVESAAGDLSVIDLVADAADWTQACADNLAPVRPSDAALAYVIYTSGSTGVPKGVMVEHHAVVNQNQALAAQWGLRASDRVLQFASLAFDASVEEIFTPLTHGATLVLRQDHWLADAASFWSLCEQHRITVADLPTQFWSQLALEGAAPAACVRWVVIGGEAVGPAALAAWFGAAHAHRPRLLNTYGPTEATITTSWQEVLPAEATWRSIGRPIANTRLYVLDGQGRPVPAGVPGELHIGGVQLARGYLGQPELTAERFIDDRFEAGGRLYKTGDLVRWLPDGSLEYLGRNDFQLKIRGFRIEPAEVEAALSALPGVREVVVLARDDDAPGQLQLVAYYTGETIGAPTLRQQAAERLPQHMVPAAYVRLEAWPLSPNGKLDRRALPAPADDAWARRGYEAPRGATEELLATLWAELLKRDRIGRHDHFFELGGHSLLAVQMMARLRSRLGREVPLADLFAHPELQAFAASVERNDAAAVPPIVAGQRPRHLPVSFAQQRLWFIAQMGDEASVAYHLSGELRLRGRLDEAALQAALDRIVQRHEALRTRFELVDGQPTQVIDPVGRFKLVRHDLSTMENPKARQEQARHWSRVEAKEPFDLGTGPLVRGRLLRLHEQDHLLCLTMHHIVSDGWSMSVLANEFSALYRAYAVEGLAHDADPLPPLPVQYADYAIWQRQWLDGAVLQRQLDFWREHLRDAPALLELPTDRPRPPVQDHVGGLFSFELDAELSSGLRRLGQRHGATLYMTLMSALAVMLSRLSGQHDLVIGSSGMNRTHTELEPLIGFFVNTLALRVQLGDDLSVAGLLAQVRATALAAQEHKELPFQQLVEALKPARSLAHSPLYQVAFLMQNTPEGALELPGLQIEMANSESTAAQSDLWWSVTEVGERLECTVVFARALFDEATVRRWSGHWQTLLRAMVADDRQPVRGLPMLSAEQRQQVLHTWNDTRLALPAGRNVHQWFEQQAASVPEAIAVACGEQVLSYAELNRRANQLAHYLIATGLKPDARVAIALERGPDMVVAMLATLKAGAAYVPLDLKLPSERLAYMLDDCRPRAVLTHTSVQDLLPASRALMTATVAELEMAGAPWLRMADTNPDPQAIGLQPSHLAYVIYTSGSTGQPKGVMVEHRNLHNLVGWHAHRFPLQPGERSSCTAGMAFDACTWEVWPPLCMGATLVLPTAEASADPGSLLDWWQSQDLHSSFLVTALADAAMARGLGGNPHLRTLLTGGDRLTRRPDAASDVELVNNYGPTEATVVATSGRCEPGDGVIHIGKPIANTRIYLLDAQGEPVPVGVPGELYVGGAGVARGYLNRAEMTQERFLPDPFSAEPEARMYRTGDLARWLPDGNIEFIGRNDHQVKIRGFRIELEEIQRQLQRQPGVREAAVLAREDQPGDKRLVAYVVAEPGTTLDAQLLRLVLARELPDYMVPAAYVMLDAMPLTANGKLDRQALPAPEGDAFGQRAYEAPQGELEETVARIWAELLQLPQVGRGDHFFELGGHSLMAVTLIERMRQAGLHIDVRTLFLKPVLQDLAAELSSVAAEAVFEVPANLIPAGAQRITPPMLPLVSLTQAQIDGICAHVEGGAANVQDIYPLAPLQEGILFHHMMAPAADPYLVQSLLGFDSRARLDTFLEALQHVIRRHDILRTGFAWEGLAQPVQVVLREVALPIEWLQLDLENGPIVQQLEALSDPRHHQLDARRAPLLRFHAAHDPEHDRWVLSILSHHLIDDNTTFKLLAVEAKAIEQGQLAQLPPPVPFRNFVAQARQGLSNEAHEAFFRDMLGAIDTPSTPFGLADTHGDGLAVSELRIVLPMALSQGLRAQARRLGVSTASLMHLAWGLVLSRATGREQVVFGTVLLGRLQGGTEAHRALGLFINTLPIRADVDGQGLEQAARATHERLAQLLRHEHASLALAQRCSGVPAQVPLFASLLNYRHSEEIGSELDDDGPIGQGIVPLGGYERTNYPLTLSVDDLGDGFALTAQASEPLQPERVCAFMQAALEQLLQGLAQAPQQPVRQLDVLPAGEREQVLRAFNDTADTGALACVHQQVQVQAARTPDAVAVEQDGQHITYRQLDEQANRLARHLVGLGVRREDRVAVCMERCIDMVVAWLATAKAGGAYVPMDPALPRERLQHLLGDSAPAVVLTRGAAQAQALREISAGLPLVDLQADAAAWQGQSAAGLPVHEGALRQLAYVIYTSGSTGQPKGVMIEHAGLANLVAWHVEAFGLKPGSRSASTAGVAFDACTWEVWPPLCSGGTLLLAPQASAGDSQQLLDWWRDAPLDVSFLVTPLAELAYATGQANPRIGTVLIGGDRLRRWPEALPAGQALVNNYGPTECSVVATSGTLHAGDAVLHIGRPIRNTRVYVLDAQGRPAPRGVAGEIHIAGAGVARGYLHAPALTEERFVRDPFSVDSEGRMYRSGDLGRWLDDGRIEYLGRNDQQVKLRGYRIEPGEIEARLCTLAGVREAVVLVREDHPGEQRLVAYCAGDALPEASQLREHAAAGLPGYMVPSAFVRLAAMPLTANGKIDVKALPAPQAHSDDAGADEAPQGPVEIPLAHLWSELLGGAPVQRHDHFFERGGHSLLAVQLVSRVRQQWGVELPLAELFEHPVLSRLAVRLQALAPSTLSAIVPADRSKPLPLSLAQQRLWFLAQVEAVSRTYHVTGAVRLRGALDEALLRQALQQVVQRHEALRTCYPLHEGQPVQVVLAADPAWRSHDLRARHEPQAAAHELMLQAADAAFDLQREAPLRAVLLRVGDDEHLLHLTLHHIAADGWSVGVLLGELGTIYGALVQGQPDPLPPLPLQYADYAAWQRGWLAEGRLQQHVDFWREALAGAPRLLELPTDRPRPAQQDGAGAGVPVVLEPALSQALQALSHRHGVTLYMTLLAAWGALLARMSGQEQVVIGSPAAGRERAEIEPLVGFFVNTLALPVDLRDDPSTATLLARTRHGVLAAREHQDLPFDQVVEAVNPPRSLAHTPLFQVMFDWHNDQGGTLAMPGLQAEMVDVDLATAQFDLMLTLQEDAGAQGQGIAGQLTYATALFDRATVERQVACWKQLLQSMVADDTQPLSALDWVPAAERQRVLHDWNDTARELPLHLCAHELFEAKVVRQPDALAVADGDQGLSYLHLNRRANQLARHLRERLGVGPDVRVALCAERGAPMVSALLAILKAGGAYVPLDPAYPGERIAHMLRDSAPAAVLCTPATREQVAAQLPPGVPLLDLQADRRSWNFQPGYNLTRLQVGVEQRHLAYVIYTSGSTGKPKGVMVEHRGLVNYTLEAVRCFGLQPGDRVLQQNSLNFDLSIEEMLPALAAGATLVPSTVPFGAGDADEQDPSLRPTMLHLTAAHWHSLVGEWSRPGGAAQAARRLAGVRVVNVTGDALSQHGLRQWEAVRPEGLRLVNTYGPTEITVSCSAAEVRHEPGAARVSIGRPFANTRLLVLDARRQPVPVGVAGELYIGGVGVARGYLNLPQLTAERFIDDPFHPGGRLYKTGDLVRWRADGQLEFIGRNDFQVKLRGFRVELGEVEACLARVPGVQELCVLAREDEPGEQRLVAYYTGEPAVPADTLRQHAAQALPHYMLPSAYVHLPALPLTPGGKLDRKALPRPEGEAMAGAAFEPPQGEVEKTLARLWADLLQRERVGRHDNFFELGGHSLLAVSLVERMRQEALKADVSQLFTASTLAELAASTTRIKEILL